MISAYNLLRAAALTGGLIESARLDRKSWLWTDSLLWGFYAVGLFLFPGFMFPGNEGALLYLFIRIFASILLAYEFLWYRVKSTRDELVVGATLWSRLMGSLLLVFVFGYTFTQYPEKFTEKTLMFDMLAFVMLLLTTVYQFWRGSYRVGNGEQKGPVSNILRLLFLIFFTVGIAEMAFPSWMFPLKKLSIVEALMVRCCGALYFGTSFTAWYATSFRNDEDRINYLLSLIVEFAGCFVAVNVSYFWDGLFTPQETLFLHLMFVPALLVLAANYLMWKKQQPYQSIYNTRSKSQ